MKKLLLILALLKGVFALTLEEAISLALSESDEVKEQLALQKQGDYLAKAKYAPLMPSLSTEYNFSYNMPQKGDDTLGNAFSLKFSYNLFNGLRDYYGILSGRESKKRHTYALSDAQATTILKVKNAYISLLQTKTLLAILQERKKNVERQKSRAEQFVKQGIRAKNESLSMEILLSNTLLSIQNMQLNVESHLHTLEQLLKTQVSLEELQDIVIDFKEAFDFDALFEKILAQNPKYLDLISTQELAKLQNKSDRGAFLPMVNLSGIKHWGITSNGAIASALPLPDQIKLNVSWNLFSGLGDTYRYQASRIYTLSLSSKLEATKRDLRIKLANLLKKLQLTKEQYEISLSTLSKAEENYQILNNRYTQGIATYTELINAELVLNTARTNIAQAKYDFALARAELHHLCNQL